MVAPDGQTKNRRDFSHRVRGDYVSGPERENFLADVRAAAEAGARAALGDGHPATGGCALYSPKGSALEKRHNRHHDVIDRYFEPFIRKTEGIAVTIVSYAFLFMLVVGVVVIIFLAADIKPWDLFQIKSREIGGK